MEFSDRILSALGGWQRGWREDPVRRSILGGELVNAVEAECLAPEFRKVSVVCYRKRFLVPNNPQNGGDFGPLFLNGFVKEGLASWTTEENFAQEFKEPMREGTIAAVFGHTPDLGEVLVSFPALWADENFQAAVETFSSKGGQNADALMHFKFYQSEVVMDVELRLDEIVGLCGKSSAFDILCEAEGLRTEEERDELWRHLVNSNKFPEEPMWISTEATKAALSRAKERFLTKHGGTIVKTIENRKDLF